MDLMHCQIARQPAPPIERRRDAPGAISAIIMKLLAKTAEGRYQTAGGLEADLRRALAQWEGRGRIDAFPLGARDIPDQLLIPEGVVKLGRGRLLPFVSQQQHLISA